MKTISSAIVLSAVPLLIGVSGCESETRCPLGEEPVRVGVGTYNERWACASRSTWPESRPPSSSTTGSSDGGSGTVAASPTVQPDAGADEPSSPPATGSCGVVDATSDSIRIVEKREAGPVFAQGSSRPADGHYALVQASFFRHEAGPAGVAKLKAGIDVNGTSLNIGAENVSQIGEANESMTFLVGENGLTKVCETRHGNVAQWIFPIATGGTGAARVDFDPSTSTLRLVVARPEGETELIFSR